MRELPICVQYACKSQNIISDMWPLEEVAGLRFVLRRSSLCPAATALGSLAARLQSVPLFINVQPKRRPGAGAAGERSLSKDQETRGVVGRGGSESLHGWLKNEAKISRTRRSIVMF